jgi:hypothetical protein
MDYKDVYFLQEPTTNTYKLLSDNGEIVSASIKGAWVFCGEMEISFIKKERWELESVLSDNGAAYWLYKTNIEARKELEEYLLNHPKLRLTFITH